MYIVYNATQPILTATQQAIEIFFLDNMRKYTVWFDARWNLHRNSNIWLHFSSKLYKSNFTPFVT